jgi:hypothetical protein
MQRLILALLVLTAGLLAQNGNTIMQDFAGVPSGTCSMPMLARNAATGALYNCTAAGTWNLIGNSGGAPSGAAGGKLSGTYPNPGLNAASTDLSDTASIQRTAFTQTGTGAVARTVDAKLKDSVSVKDFGAVGNGSTDDYAAIVAAAAVAEASGYCLRFPVGTYAHATPLVFDTSSRMNCQIYDSGAMLKYTGSATTNAVTFGGAGWDYYTVDNLTVDGNNLATNGILASGLVRSSFRNTWVKNVSGSSLLCAACIQVEFNNFNVVGNNTAPTYGMHFGARATTNSSTVTIINPNIEGTATAGIYIQNSQAITIYGGTSEGNAGAGILIADTGQSNKFIGMDLESNGTFDVDISGSQTHIDGGFLQSANSVKIRSGASGNTISNAASFQGTIVLDAGSRNTSIDTIRLDPLTLITNNGTNTVMRNVCLYTSCNADVFPVVTVPYGGTGLTTLTNHAVQVGAATSNVTQVGPNAATTYPLFSAGSSADPAFRAIAAADLPGTLSSGTAITNAALTTPSIGAATGTSLVATGIVSGLAPITYLQDADPCPTGTHCAVGATYQMGYIVNGATTEASATFFDLPAAVAGQQYCFENGAGDSGATTGVMKVIAASGDYITLVGVKSATSGSTATSGGAAGDAACFIAIKGDEWILKASKGTWTTN